MINSKFTKLHNNFGVISAFLTDPLSLLINRIIGINDTNCNSIGFYYEIMPEVISVNLFNIYDNNPISWCRLGYSMDKLLLSPYVNKISFYPLIDNKYSNIFRTLCIENLSINSNNLSTRYEEILLELVDIPTNQKYLTGFSIINTILSTVMREKLQNIPNNIIVQNKILKIPRNIITDSNDTNNSDNKYIIEETRKEIVKLSAIFLNLFTTNNLFRNKFLSISEYYQKINTSQKLIKLGSYINELTNSLNNNSDTLFNINELISLFNDLCKNSNINIPVDDKISSGQITFVSSGNFDNNTDNSKIISIYNGNIKHFSDDILLDILLYIDSLRDSNGESNNKYSYIQNKIVIELSERKKK